MHPITRSSSPAPLAPPPLRQSSSSAAATNLGPFPPSRRASPSPSRCSLATASGEACELSRSPWDLIAELSLFDPMGGRHPLRGTPCAARATPDATTILAALDTPRAWGIHGGDCIGRSPAAAAAIPAADPPPHPRTRRLTLRRSPSPRRIPHARRTRLRVRRRDYRRSQ
ncbi:hypothetical protein PVAP13_3NG152601 [Panicum virgatum]|uniref:Uncharacterized protein n=1 Tax=Panicum virgatum TaxID=38727 RepID=A0A8T0UBK2_PANVG|nr:hypothetical protein PVAP13_3NG152601 [Panicum virgatum]